MPPEHIQNALQAIQDSEWTEIYKRLYLYTIIKIKTTKDGRHRVIKGIPTIQHPLSEDMAKDFAHEAIKKIWSGERKTWKPQKPLVKSLLKYLMGVIDSLLSAEVTSAENARCISMERFKNNDPENGEGMPFQIADSCPTPEEQVLAQDEFQKFQSFCKTDLIVSKIFECALEGIIKPNEVAKYIGCTAAEVTNAKKRMARMARQFFWDNPLFI